MSDLISSGSPDFPHCSRLVFGIKAQIVKQGNHLEFTDFSPPTNPSLDEQRDALRKGLGRCAAWANSGRLVSKLLLEACLHDQRFDRQIEENRGDWLWSLIKGANAASQLQKQILDALKVVSLEKDAYQLCQLAMNYAIEGDSLFCTQLCDFVKNRQIPGSPYIGEGQLLAIMGEEALELIAKLRGQHLVNHDWEWDDDSVVDHAIAEIGEERTVQFLDQAIDPNIRRFAEAWRRSQSAAANPTKPQEAFREQVRQFTLQRVFAAAETGEGQQFLRTWGQEASNNDLLAIQNRLWHEQDPKILARLLSVFWRRALPQFDARLIDLCRHSDPQVRHRALNALEENAHPTVRELAWAELHNQTLSERTISLFVHNFECGDEPHLLELLSLPDNLDHRHWMCRDLVYVLEENPEADSSQLAMVAYFHQPCSYCRQFAAALLKDRNAAPRWLMNECRFDVEEDCRELFEPKT